MKALINITKVLVASAVEVDVLISALQNDDFTQHYGRTWWLETNEQGTVYLNIDTTGTSRGPVTASMRDMLGFWNDDDNYVPLWDAICEGGEVVSYESSQPAWKWHQDRFKAVCLGSATKYDSEGNMTEEYLAACKKNEALVAQEKEAANRESIKGWSLEQLDAEIMNGWQYSRDFMSVVHKVRNEFMRRYYAALRGL